jgi:serine/threonine protein kinase
MVQTKFVKNYSYGLLDYIGKGFSSEVFKGKNDSTGEIVAIRVIDMHKIKNEVQMFLLKNETEVIPKLNSKNVLKSLEILST